METSKSLKKRVIVAFWKLRNTQKIEVFSNLKIFCDSYPEFSYNTLNNYLSKAKTSFESDQLILQRQELITKPILMEKKVRQIKPVVNRYEQATHDEEDQNLDFWLAAEPEERIYAVTKLISEGIPKGSKVQIQKVEKFKLKK